MSEKHYSNDWAKSKSRELVRGVIERNVLGYRKPKDVRVLFFPGIDAQEVFEVYDPLGIPRENLVGVEMEKDIAEHVSQMGLGIRVVNKTLSDYLDEQGNGLTFDIISLDYHNPINREQLNMIEKIAITNRRNSFVFHHANLIRRDAKSHPWYMTGYMYSRECMEMLEPGYEMGKALRMRMEMFDHIQRKMKEGESIKDEKMMSYSSLIYASFFGSSAESIERAFKFAARDRYDEATAFIERYFKTNFGEQIPFDREHPVLCLGALGYHPGVVKLFEEVTFKLVRDEIAAMGFAPQAFLAIIKPICDWAKQRRFFNISDMEVYSYISESGSPMIGDVYHLVSTHNMMRHSEKMVQSYARRDIRGIRKHAHDTANASMKQVSTSKLINLDEKERNRQFLGSSARPVLTKQKAIEEMITGASIEELKTKYRGTDNKPVAAWKAHVTMGTYKDNPAESDADLETITKAEAVELLSSGIPVDEVFDTYPTSFTKGQLRAFKAHITMGSYEKPEAEQISEGLPHQ